jgi:HK97 family phage prohead protease
MPAKLLSCDDFRAAARNGGAAPEATVFRFATSEPQNVAGAERTKRFVFSDATIDHAGDSIDPKGWDLGTFRKNPVALFSHMSWEPPIGRAKNVAVTNGKLVGDIEFASAEVYEFADTIFRLVDGGFMKAVSVGFKPTKWALSNDKNRPAGIDFKQQTLLEISVCPVPCNPNALGEARSLGIDTAPLREWAEKVLDSSAGANMPRRQLETLRRQAGDVAERRHFVARLKRELAANKPETPAERLAEVEQIRSDITMRQVRVAEVAAIRRTLPAPPIPSTDEILRRWRAEQGDRT